MKHAIALAMVSAVTVLFACGPRGTSELVPTQRRVASGDAAVVGRLDVAVEDGVRFDLAVTNEGGRKAEIAFPSGQTHDVIVRTVEGREVWRWSAGRLFTSGLQQRVLRAGDTLHFVERWAPPAPGRYEVIATVASASHPVEQRAQFTVR